MPLRPKPEFMTPKDGHRFLEEQARHQTDLNVWAAEAMQDAADRIEKALTRREELDYAERQRHEFVAGR